VKIQAPDGEIRRRLKGKERKKQRRSKVDNLQSRFIRTERSERSNFH
jgi:hypothetical protein